jgi:hypothetical protein
MTFYLTFGQRYLRESHPLFPAAHPDGWIQIEAPTYAAARSLAAQHLKDRWAFLYSADDFRPELFPLGALAQITIDGLELYNV